MGLEHPGYYVSPREYDKNGQYSYDTDAASLMGRGMELRAFYFDAWAKEATKKAGYLIPEIEFNNLGLNRNWKNTYRYVLESRTFYVK